MSLWETGNPVKDAATERHIEQERQTDIDRAERWEDHPDREFHALTVDHLFGQGWEHIVFKREGSRTLVRAARIIHSPDENGDHWLLGMYDDGFNSWISYGMEVGARHEMGIFLTWGGGSYE